MYLVEGHTAVHHNPQKNDPRFDDFRRWIEKLSGGPISRKEALDEEASEIARGYRDSYLKDALERLRKKEDRDDDARKLKEAHRILRRNAELFFDDPSNPSLQIKKWKKTLVRIPAPPYNRIIAHEVPYDVSIKLMDYLVRE